MNQIASQSISYSQRACSGNGQLVLEHSHQLRQGRQVFDYVRLFPSVPAQMDVIGNASVRYVGTESMERRDLLTLSGGDRVSLNTPRRWVDPCATDGLGAGGPWQGYGQLLGAGGVSIKSHWSRDVTVGTSISPTIHYDGDTNQLVANMPAYGKYEVKYQAGYNLYKITRSGDSAKRECTVSAFYRGVSAETMLVGLTQPYQIPLYYVTSDYVADENGQWEIPGAWPGHNTYADDPRPENEQKKLPGPDIGSYHQLRRVHEAAYLTSEKVIHVERQLCATCNPLQPFGGYGLGDYQRSFIFREQEPPGPGDEAYADFIGVWAYIDFAGLLSDAASRFPGLARPGADDA